MKKINFTIYFPNKGKIEKWLNDIGISFKTYDQAFISFYEIEPQYKMMVRNYILKNNLQDGMNDEFRWLGWAEWNDGIDERKALGFDKKAH